MRRRLDSGVVGGIMGSEGQLTQERQMKTRSEILSECANAATGCWNHYSDTRLSEEQQNQLLASIDKALPESVKTADWQAYSDDYNRRMEEEA